MTARTVRERLGTAAILSAMALVVLDAGTVNVALPSLAAAFAAAPADAMLVVTAYQVALLAALLPCARLAERIGYRRLFAGGILVFACAAVLAAAAPTLTLLVAARALQGLGAAAILALGIPLLRFALGAERLAAAIAWNAMVVALCSALGPALGALLLTGPGWRWIFLAALPLAPFILFAARALPAVEATRSSIDALTVFLYAAAIVGLVAAAESARTFSGQALILAGAAVAAALWLVARERAKQAPLVPFDLLALRAFRRPVAASILLFAGQSGGLLSLPFLLQLSLGRGALATGLILALWPLAVAGTSRFAARLAGRHGMETVCAAGGIVLALGLAATASLAAAGSLPLLALCVAVCGAGFGLFQVPNNRNMFLSAPEARSAAAGGLQGTARLAGQTIGALCVAALLSAAPLAVAPRVAIALAAAAALGAALVVRPRRARRPESANVAPEAAICYDSVTTCPR